MVWIVLGVNGVMGNDVQRSAALLVRPNSDRMSYSHLLPPSWKSQVTAWLQEDTPSFDYGGFVVGEVEKTAFLLGKGKEPAVLAGVPFVNEIFAQLECRYAQLQVPVLA